MSEIEQQHARQRLRRGYLFLALGLLFVLLSVGTDKFVPAAALLGVSAVAAIGFGIARRSAAWLLLGGVFVLMGVDVVVIHVTRDEPIVGPLFERIGELVLLVLCLAAPIMLGVARRRSLPRTALAWKCHGCGHDLFGLTVPCCPECGRAIDAEQIAKAPPGVFRLDPSATPRPDKNP